MTTQDDMGVESMRRQLMLNTMYMKGYELLKHLSLNKNITVYEDDINLMDVFDSVNKTPLFTNPCVCRGRILFKNSEEEELKSFITLSCIRNIRLTVEKGSGLFSFFYDLFISNRDIESIEVRDKKQKLLYDLIRGINGTTIINVGKDGPCYDTRFTFHAIRINSESSSAYLNMVRNYDITTIQIDISMLRYSVNHFIEQYNRGVNYNSVINVQILDGEEILSDNISHYINRQRWSLLSDVFSNLHLPPNNPHQLTGEDDSV